MAVQVAQETEIHRQHVRLRIPIAVEIDGQRFAVDDWSIGGFGVQGDLGSRQPGERFPVRVAFPFEDFEVTLRLDGQMVYHQDDRTRFGCRFVAISRGQLDLFRYIVDSYLSGEIVSGGDILSLASRDPSTDAGRRMQPVGFVPVKRPRSMVTRIGHGLGALALVLAGAALAYFAWQGARERWFMVRAEAAIVQAPVYRLRSPVAGTIVRGEPQPLLQPNDAIAAVTPANGRQTALRSPCECTLLEWSVPAGADVAAGDTVALLAAADQPLTVRASVSADAARRLAVGDLAEIVLPGRQGVILGQIERVDTRAPYANLANGAALGEARRTVQVVVRPDSPLDFDSLGSYVDVRFP